ncbi:unnamed protein product [Dracunculus medinensis]|uniref:Uncharacterized protein n=1 Tax=Dracunculus medinensis TaxID=318479 RepID=A0A0N4UQG8_DRAME|nr:unnamed protein product [Dracunculus medinensis]
MCMQCSRHDLWYSPHENEKAIEKCQRGQIQPTLCHNISSTHCIRSFYRKGFDSGEIIIERRCGVLQEISGCTLYKSPRKKRHIIWNEPAAKRDTSQNSFVEVCVEGCEGESCIMNSVPASLSLLFYSCRLISIFLFFICFLKSF